MILIPIIFSVILGAILIMVLLKNTKLKTITSHLKELNTTFENENHNFQLEKLKMIQELEQTKAKLSLNEKLIADFDKMRADSQAATRSALFDLGNELSKQLIDIHKKENQQSREDSEKRIQETTDKFNNEFERLVSMIGSLNKEISQSKSTVDLIKNSLLSPSGAGQLAEITLENLLKNSGLRKGVDFSIQYSTVEYESKKLRPDAVIFLPSDNLMVIDAKSSKYLIDNQESGELNKNVLARSMNIHLKTLLDKNYGEAVLASVGRKKVSMVITLMFLPSEHAIEKIMEADPEFLNKAWVNNIFPVGPAGLMNMLSFAKFQITEQLMFENHKLIIEEVKKLLGSVANLTEYSSKLGSTIQSLVNNYDKFAASFNRNFLVRAKAVSRLGVDIGSSKGEKIIAEPLARYQIVTSGTEVLEVEGIAEEKNENKSKWLKNS